MINKPLKELIESLSDTLNAVRMNKTVTDETIFVQACTFLRTPGLVGKPIEESYGKEEEKAKNTNRKPTKKQLDFLYSKNIDFDADTISGKQASDLISKYIAEHPRKK